MRTCPRHSISHAAFNGRSKGKFRQSSVSSHSTRFPWDNFDITAISECLCLLRSFSNAVLVSEFTKSGGRKIDLSPLARPDAL